MARAALNEIIPSRLYQRGQFLTWPHEQKRRTLDRHGVTIVVNLWAKVDPDLARDDTGRVYLNWVCSPSELPPDADATVAYLAALLSRRESPDEQARYTEPGTVFPVYRHCALIHCEAGRGRSVWLTARIAQALQPERDRAAVAREVLERVGSYDVKPVLANDLGLGFERQRT